MCGGLRAVETCVPSREGSPARAKLLAVDDRLTGPGCVGERGDEARRPIGGRSSACGAPSACGGALAQPRATSRTSPPRSALLITKLYTRLHLSRAPQQGGLRLFVVEEGGDGQAEDCGEGGEDGESRIGLTILEAIPGHGLDARGFGCRVDGHSAVAPEAAQAASHEIGQATKARRLAVMSRR